MMFQLDLYSPQANSGSKPNPICLLFGLQVVDHVSVPASCMTVNCTGWCFTKHWCRAVTSRPAVADTGRCCCKVCGMPVEHTGVPVEHQQTHKGLQAESRLSCHVGAVCGS